MGCGRHTKYSPTITFCTNTIYFKVVEVQIQASERILKLGRRPKSPVAYIAFSGVGNDRKHFMSSPYEKEAYEPLDDVGRKV
jgi:hypothetical protein